MARKEVFRPMVSIKKYSLFVVDHMPAHRAVFQDTLGAWPHFVCYCSGLDECRHLLTGVAPDIILCNYHVPGDLQEFLRFVHARCPHAIRIVYGEEAEQESLLRLLGAGLAHRTFLLPFGPEVITALEQDLALRSRIRTRKCWDFMKRRQGLPSLPPVMAELEQVLQDPASSLSRVAAVLGRDPLLAARLLQIVNSAFCSRKAAIDSLERAVAFLGISSTRKIVLFLCALGHFRYPRNFHQHALKVIDHSIHCGALAGMVARDLAPGQERTAVTAGILHDIGKLIFLASLEEDLQHSPSFMANYGLFATEVEEQVFGISHLELGSSLLIWWNLPLVMVEAAANHSQPLHALSGVTRCVAVADRCLSEAVCGTRLSTDLDFLSPRYPVEKWRQCARGLVGEKIVPIAA
jgi:putative nucleotidyltransferase with HDIG domain